MNQSHTSQPTENAPEIAGQTVRPKYVMPGLSVRIASNFRRKRGVIPTVRTIAKRMGVKPALVMPAIADDLYREVAELRAIVSRRPPASASLTPEPGRLQIVTRRSA